MKLSLFMFERFSQLLQCQSNFEESANNNDVTRQIEHL